MRPEGKKVSVVLPTYCEKDNIVPLIHGLHENIAAPLEIIVVDDASPDGTADVVAALADPDVKLIRRKARGLAAAFNRGIIESTGNIICWMDADTCMPPEVLRQMVDKLDEYDIAIGSRYGSGGVVDLWLDGDEPRLRWNDLGSASSGWGAASCGK